MNGATYLWPPRILDEREAAYYLGVSPGTFRAQLMATLPPIKLTERRNGWDRLTLDEWVDRKSGRESGAPTPLPPEPYLNPWDEDVVTDPLTGKLVRLASPPPPKQNPLDIASRPKRRRRGLI